MTYKEYVKLTENLGLERKKMPVVFIWVTVFVSFGLIMQI